MHRDLMRILGSFPVLSIMLEKVWRKETRLWGGNVNWYSHYGDKYRGSEKTKNRATI